MKASALILFALICVGLVLAALFLSKPIAPGATKTEVKTLSLPASQTVPTPVSTDGQRGGTIEAAVLPERTGHSSGNSASGFDSARDLFRFAMDAANSSDPLVMISGWRATQDCRAIRGLFAQIEDRRVYSGENESLKRVSQAVSELFSRCAGFINSDSAAISGLSGQFVAKLRGVDENFYIPTSVAGPISAKQFSRVLEIGDWMTFGQVTVDILGKMIEKRGIDRAGLQAQMMGLALLQMPCEVGMNCGPDGLYYLIECGVSKVCPGSMWAVFSEGLSAEQVRTIDRMRSEIAGAFLRRDLSYFGFDLK
jgi:hypothetical protein